MDVNTTFASPPSVTDYPALFRGYIVSSVQFVLAQVREVRTILPPYERDLALHILTFSLKLPEAWPDTATLLLTMAPKMELAGYRDEWIPYLEQGLQQSQVLDDGVVEAKLRLYLGILHRLIGKYEEAGFHLEQSAETFESLKMTLYQAKSLNQLAHIARLRRRYSNAIQWIDSALNLLNHQENSEQAYSYLILALITTDKAEWQKSIKFCLKALNIWEQERDYRMMGRILVILGGALEKSKQFKESISACQRAIALLEKVGDSVYQATAQMNLGNVYLAQEQYYKALELYLPARKVFQRVQDQVHLIFVTHNIGMASRKLKLWEEAEGAFLLAIEQEKKLGNIAWLVNTMDGLGMLYLDKRDVSASVAIFGEALEQLDQIKGDPKYDSLHQMISQHLKQALNQLPAKNGYRFF